MKQYAARSIQRGVDERRRVAGRVGFAVRSGRDGTAPRKVRIGTHAAPGDREHVVHQVTGSAVHRKASEWAWIQRRSDRFNRINNWIACICIVNVAAVVQKSFERLSEACLKKESFADRLLGSRSSCRLDGRRWTG